MKNICIYTFADPSRRRRRVGNLGRGIASVKESWDVGQVRLTPDWDNLQTRHSTLDGVTVHFIASCLYCSGRNYRARGKAVAVKEAASTMRVRVPFA